MVMEISNQKRSTKIKRAFNISGIAIVLVGLAFLWMKNDTMVLIIAGIFVVYVGLAQYANLCYVNFITNNGKVLIRYYPVISIMKKEYEAIEFSQQALVNFKIEKVMGLADLQISIRTKRGIAEYPPISLAALSRAEIQQISSALTEIIHPTN